MTFRASPGPKHALILAAALSLLSPLAMPSAAAQDASPQFEVRKTTNTAVKFSVTAFNDGDYSKAARYSRMAITSGLSPNRRAVAYNNLCASLGAMSEAEDNLSAALDACDAALELRPSLSEALNNRGMIRMKQGDVIAAKADFTAASGNKG